jgi:hypothetical protein
VLHITVLRRLASWTLFGVTQNPFASPQELYNDISLTHLLVAGITGSRSASVNPFPFYLLTKPQYIITTPNNLIASALVIQFWFNQTDYDGPASNPAIYVTIILITIIAINYFGVGIFGEFEFALSSLKVLIMIGLMFLTLILAAGGGGDGDPKGFRYWSHPGAFAEYIQGWCYDFSDSKRTLRICCGSSSLEFLVGS